MHFPGSLTTSRLSFIRQLPLWAWLARLHRNRLLLPLLPLR
jgi:hypothetical protein